ncbi:MAG: polysaccharide deacetylase family protein [Oscillospiraceae bacterium]|nr:polysaccharide deacetylase family protein [Oscillospiraceae bacterium]
MEKSVKRIRSVLLPPFALFAALWLLFEPAAGAETASGAATAADRTVPVAENVSSPPVPSPSPAESFLPPGARELRIVVDGAELAGPCWSVPGDGEPGKANAGAADRAAPRHYAPADQFLAALDGDFWAGEKEALDLDPFLFPGQDLVCVEDACAALGISLYRAPDDGQLWCSSAAGDWAVPEGVRVPVLMYHGVGDDLRPGEELVVRTEDLEAQLRLLLDRGYTPIWFSDLKHADQIRKPVLLTFDDGYRDNYTELFPLLRRYGVKATIFVVPGYLENEHCLGPDEIREMLASGLVSIQCHTWYHLDLDTLSYEEQIEQLCWSKVMLLELTDREPYVIAYPRGRQNDDTLAICRGDYRFGVKMGGAPYVTGDDPLLIHRISIPRSMRLDEFAALFP